MNGDISAIAFMANGYFDIELIKTKFTPYIGLGIGFSNIDADITAPNISPLQLIDDSATVFAYQIMAGVGLDLNPKVTLTLDYRYFATTDPDFSPGPFFGPGLPDIESEYQNHSINIGGRFYF